MDVSVQRVSAVGDKSGQSDMLNISMSVGMPQKTQIQMNSKAI